jgi:ABC-2 type transport system ATP-binding protein
MASPVLRIQHLTKDFPGGTWRATTTHRALDDVSFDVRAGVVFGLLGPNGAGKSTTLNLLLNLLRPTSGTVSLFGRAADDVSVRSRVGFLPEQPRFYGHMTPEQLLAYFAALFGIPSSDVRARISRVFDRVGVEAERRRPLRSHSKGMLQRVGIAQALLNDPELVILDEPMSGLDPFGRRMLRELTRELAAEGRTVVFSSHILSDVEQLCDEVAILARGRLVAQGALASLVAGRTLEDVFFEAVGR